MKLKQYIITSLLIAIGFVLHAVIPAFFGMKFDMLLAFMLLAMLLNPQKENAMAAGLLGGILTAATTTFPGGQIANLVDKLITAAVVYILIHALVSLKNTTLKTIVVGFVGTLVSGTTFLLTALFVAGLPAPFSALFFTVVIPTALLTAAIIPVLYRSATLAMRSTSLARR